MLFRSALFPSLFLVLSWYRSWLFCLNCCRSPWSDLCTTGTSPAPPISTPPCHWVSFQKSGYGNITDISYSRVWNPRLLIATRMNSELVNMAHKAFYNCTLPYRTNFVLHDLTYTGLLSQKWPVIHEDTLYSHTFASLLYLFPWKPLFIFKFHYRHSSVKPLLISSTQEALDCLVCALFHSVLDVSLLSSFNIIFLLLFLFWNVNSLRTGINVLF